MLSEISRKLLGDGSVEMLAEVEMIGRPKRPINFLQNGFFTTRIAMLPSECMICCGRFRAVG